MLMLAWMLMHIAMLVTSVAIHITTSATELFINLHINYDSWNHENLRPQKFGAVHYILM